MPLSPENNQHPTLSRSAAELLAQTREHLRRQEELREAAKPPKPRTLAELFAATDTRLANASPFTERVAAVVPGLRTPRPRVVPGPTPKAAPTPKATATAPTDKLPERAPAPMPVPEETSKAASPFSFVSQTFAPANEGGRPTTVSILPKQRPAASPFSVTHQTFAPTAVEQSPAHEDKTATTDISTAGGVSPFSIQKQTFAPTTDESAGISMRPRTTVITKGSFPAAAPDEPADAPTPALAPPETVVSSPFSLPHTPEPPQSVVYRANAEEEEVHAPARPILPLIPEAADAPAPAPAYTAPQLEPTQAGTPAVSVQRLVANALFGADAETFAATAEESAPDEGDLAADPVWYTEMPHSELPEVAEASEVQAEPRAVAYPYPAPEKHCDQRTVLAGYRTHLRVKTAWTYLRLFAALVVFSTSTLLSLAAPFGISLPTLLSPAVYPLIFHMADMELCLLSLLLVLPTLFLGLGDALHGRATHAAFFAVPSFLYVLARIAEIVILCTKDLTPALPCATPVLCLATVLLLCGELAHLSVSRRLCRRTQDNAFAFAVEPSPTGRARMTQISYPTGIAAHTAQPIPYSASMCVLLPLLCIAAIACGAAGFVQTSSLATSLDIGIFALLACFPLALLAGIRLRFALSQRSTLAHYGATMLSPADMAHFDATDAIILPEVALFSDSETHISHLSLADDTAHSRKYLLQAVGDALGGGIGLAITRKLESYHLPHTAAITKQAGQDEDGMEVTVDGSHILRIGLHTFMLRHRIANVVYTDEDAALERSGKAQILFLEEDGICFAKLHLVRNITPMVRDAVMDLSAAGKEVIIETEHPFFDEETLLDKLGDTRAPIRVCRTASALRAPAPATGRGGLLAESAEGALALLCLHTARKPRRLYRACAHLVSLAAGVAVLWLSAALPALAPWAPLLCAGLLFARIIL